MDAIIAALVSGIVTLAGVLIANGKSQAVTDVKIEELTGKSASTIPLLKKSPSSRSKSKSQIIALMIWNISTN